MLSGVDLDDRLSIEKKRLRVQKIAGWLISWENPPEKIKENQRKSWKIMEKIMEKIMADHRKSYKIMEHPQ